MENPLPQVVIRPTLVVSQDYVNTSTRLDINTSSSCSCNNMFIIIIILFLLFF